MIRLDMLGSLALRGADGRELRAVLAQPKRLGLLAYLAIETRFHRRDQLFSLFWPELSQAQARQSLRQSLYFLRRELGERVVANRGGEEIGVAPDALQCDVREFVGLLGQGRLEDALALYRGDLLAGFFVSDASTDFEQWLDGTRAQLRTRAVEAAWALADNGARDGRLTEATRWARWAARLAPLDERSLQRLVSLLDRQGDRAGALRAYNEFAERLRAELAVEPSCETRALVDGVRRRDEPSLGAIPDDPEDTARTMPAAVSARPDAPAHAAMPNRTVSRLAYLTAGGLAAALILAALAPRIAHSRSRLPVIAVGWIQDPSGADTGATVRTFAELLSDNLARMPDLRVVSHARLYDVMSQLGAPSETPSVISEAARRAGADELLEAVLARAATGPNATLRLELRPIDLSTGTSGRAHILRANSVFELADRATAQVAADLGLRMPTRPLTDVTTTSLAAHRLYEDGLRRFYASQTASAVPLFHAALDEDSTFAMAAYYAGLGELNTDGLAARRDLSLSLRVAQRVSDRERLIIQQTWAYLTNEPTQLALAESLATRYPDEPGAELALGRAIAWQGDFLGALPHLRRAVHLDTLGLSGRSPSCRACDALDIIMSVYLSVDSFPAAERTARAHTRAQPGSAAAWWALADVFARETRIDSALADERIAERVGGSEFGYVVPRVVIDIRSGQFAAADRTLRDRLQYGSRDVQAEALWWLVISLRNQGRLGEALGAAQRLAQLTSDAPPGFNVPRPIDRVAQGQVLFEMGRYREAAQLFDTMADYSWRESPDFPRSAPGLVARHRIWMTTHAATALAAAGDTALLPSLIDSLTAWGPKSAFVRDRALHHYVRGLLLTARGDRAGAEGEMRAALVAPVDGYSRINYQLAALLLADGRAREAIPVLQDALRGAVEASNYYLTGTDVQARLGQAFDRAGEVDSALVHYRRALAAWRNADPAFRARTLVIAMRVRALELQGSHAAPAAPR